jgi:Fur family ferric uptake transcriptional regulator
MFKLRYFDSCDYSLRVETSMKNQKLRMTRQRKVILEELRKVKTHPCADEIYETVRRRLPRISLGTVYRNLEILSKLGEIQKLEVGGVLKRFDGIPENHYHIRCTCCGRVSDVPIPTMEGLEDEIRSVSDFTVLGHRLEFIGECAGCAAEIKAA